MFFEREKIIRVSRQMSGEPITEVGKKLREEAIKNSLDPELSELFAIQSHIGSLQKSMDLVLSLASPDCAEEALLFIFRAQDINVEDDGGAGSYTALLSKMSALLDIDFEIMLHPEKREELSAVIFDKAQEIVTSVYFASFVAKNIHEIANSLGTWAEEILLKMDLSLDSLSGEETRDIVVIKQALDAKFLI